MGQRVKNQRMGGEGRKKKGRKELSGETWGRGGGIRMKHRKWEGVGLRWEETDSIRRE